MRCVIAAAAEPMTIPIATRRNWLKTNLLRVMPQRESDRRLHSPSGALPGWYHTVRGAQSPTISDWLFAVRKIIGRRRVKPDKIASLKRAYRLLLADDKP